MKNKLSVLLALFFLLCTAMCCEEFEEYIPCQVTLTGIGKVEHLDNAGSVPVAPVGGVVSRQAYMLRIPLDFEYEKEIVEGTYYEYILLIPSPIYRLSHLPLMMNPILPVRM